MKRPAITLMLVLSLIFLPITSSAGIPQGIQAAEPIRREQQFEVTFHRPTLTNGNVAWVNNTDIVSAGPALSQQEIEQGFNVGDYIAIRIKAPIDCFVYGVNNSQWDGATLIENGEKLQAGVQRDFVYRLTNRHGGQGTGNENILFLIRTNVVPQEEVARFLQPPSPSTSTIQGAPQPQTSNAAGSQQIQLSGTPVEREQLAQSFQKEQKKAGKGGVILKISCGIASMFFPFVKTMCNAATALGVKGFSAAEPVRRGQLQPQADTQNMVIQFSFPLRAV